MNLTTDRIRLRNFEKKDVEQYYKISSSESVKQYFPYYSESLEEAEEIIDIFSNSDFYSNYYIAIEDRELNLLVGTIIVEKINDCLCNIGYFIGEGYQGNGYCTASLIKIFNFLRTQGFAKACLSIESENVGSIKVAKKIGALQVSSKGSFTAWKANL